MKVCPVCKATYDDDAENCDDDGEALIAAENDALDENPELKDVLQVNPDDATSMIDLEAMEDKIRERVEQKRAADVERAARAMKEAERLDPDATGTLDLESLEKKLASRQGGDVEDVTKIEKHEQTLVTRQGKKGDSSAEPRAPSGAAKKADAPPRDRGRVVTIALLAIGVVGAIGAAVGIGLYVTRGEPLTVISVPPGATVVVDGQQVGQSPVTARAAVGSHTIELTLAGYEPFKDVVDVPKGGTSFREPLKALPEGARPKPEARADAGTVDGGPSADDVTARVRAFIASKDFDGALAAIKALIAANPDDARADALLAEVTDAKTGGGATRTGDDATTAPGGRDKTPDKRPGGKRPRDPEPRPVDDKPVGKEKAASARGAYEDGERAYQSGRVDDAKLSFKESIQLDPRFYLPHRSVARIYEREGNIKQARYHLQRYLDLGGPDADLKVRRWLESHP